VAAVLGQAGQFQELASRIMSSSMVTSGVRTDRILTACRGERNSGGRGSAWTWSAAVAVAGRLTAPRSSRAAGRSARRDAEDLQE